MDELYCLGDSLTFGLGVRKQERWTSLLAGQAGCSVINLGVSGDTTGGMLVRFRTEVLPGRTRSGADVSRRRVLLMGGSNDIVYSGTSIGARSNMGALIHQTRAAGLEPVVGIPMPFVPEQVPEQWQAAADFEQAGRELEDYCAWLIRFCGAFSVKTVDFRQDFVTAGGAVKAELYLDGLHPNPEGHRRMARRLAEFLEAEQGAAP